MCMHCMLLTWLLILCCKYIDVILVKLTKYNFQSQNKCHSKQGQLKDTTPKTENTVYFGLKFIYL